jgi:glucan 1,3-beta-glucosidase
MQASEKLHGVNLGGWLVLEKWLTSSVFDGADAQDEYELSQTKSGRERIRKHRKNFIREEDFRWLHEHNIDLIRLPVGYWAVEESDGYVSARKELEWAIRMAKKYDIKVLIDLHAAPGGQNIADHSGHKGEMKWFLNVRYQKKTLTILKTIAKRYGHESVLWGIELLNEPESRGNVRRLRKFYQAAYDELSQLLPPGKYIVFHDAFRPHLFIRAIRARRNHPAVMDVHWYSLLTNRHWKLAGYLHASSLVRRLLIFILTRFHPLIIGEWSTVMPQHLFDDAEQSVHPTLLKRNFLMQEKAYRNALGSTYWNYKADGRGMYHYRSLVEDGIIDL